MSRQNDMSSNSRMPKLTLRQQLRKDINELAYAIRGKLNKTTFEQAENIALGLKRPSVEALTDFKTQLETIRDSSKKGKQTISLSKVRKNVKVTVTKHQHYRSTAEEYRFTLPKRISDLRVFASHVKTQVITKMTEFRKQNPMFKVALDVSVDYYKATDKDVKHSGGHSTGFKENKGQSITAGSNLSSIYDSLVNKLIADIEAFTQLGSGWVIELIKDMSLQLVRNEAFNGKSYIPLPDWVANKKCCINVKNTDDKCFMWSLLSALHPATRDAERVSKYKEFVDKYDWSQIEFPVETTEYANIEKHLDVPFNVFCLDETAENNKYYVEYKSTLVVTSSVVGGRHHPNKTPINLLRYEMDENTHFCWIKNLNGFVRYNSDKAVYTCPYCLSIFYRPDTFAKHRTSNKCSMSYDGLAMKVLPKRDDAVTEFKHWSKLLQVPFVIYADIESVLKPVNMQQGESTTVEQEHIANHIGCRLVSRYPELLDDNYKQFDGENCIDQFLEYLFTMENRVADVLDSTNIPMNLTTDEEIAFQNATHCWACNGVLDDDRVRDHDHLNGRYRGAAHNHCNLEMNNRRTKLPIIFHNLRGYDSHFIVKAASKYNRQLSCIPNTMDKYMSFSIGRKLVFLDSLQFVATSLENLVNALNQEGDKMFPVFNRELGIPLLRQKGVFPYDWFDSVDKLNLPELPSKKEFYSKLNECHISDSDYAHACQVWRETGCKTFYDYVSLYLKTDVVLLADCFEAFRDACLKNYMIDPCHHFTSPGMSWNAMMLQLKREGIDTSSVVGGFSSVNAGRNPQRNHPKSIGLFDNGQQDMLEMIKSNMRGGISMISNRYARANNPYMSDYDASVENSYITYLDANNLYGWAMSQYLPVGDYRWENRQFDDETIISLPDEGVRGYVFEVDLEYPSDLHDKHSDYPLAPEATSFDASPFMNNIAEKLDSKPVKTTKLVPNLCDKTNYVVHYRNLKFYLNQGLKLKKVHRVLSFEQSPWLADYISKNTARRAATKVAFEKDLFKLMNNAVFGKTMENVDNHIDVKLISEEKKLVKLASKCNFDKMRIFDDDLVAVQMGKTTIKYDKPVIAGFAILELSKLLMYNFHYGFIKQEYGDKAKLLFTDTDSLCYHIQTDDLYVDMFKHKELFDWCDFSSDVMKRINVEDIDLLKNMNKKVIGKFKDETEGVAVKEFVGLRAKMYSLLLDSGKSKNTAKGVKKNKIKTECKHSRYLESLFEVKPHKVSFRNIRSVNHQVLTMNQTKTGLSCYDDKRYVLDDNIRTLAHGHYRSI